jgi:CRISPR system Cascade subunit CasC
MLIEIHMLQNHSPSNLNRDDTGSPKECVFGGVRRARISSQCLKRSIRRSPLFQEEMAGHLASRTRRLPQLVRESLLAFDVAEDLAEIAAKKASGFGNKDGKEQPEAKTAQTMFLTDADVAAVTETLLAAAKEAGSAKKFEKVPAKDLQAKAQEQGFRPITVDIALFGRMITSEAFRNVEASAQVAHAISTHKVDHEFDYFTAVDDLKTPVEAEEEGDAGADMLGDVEFNSACYYKYFSIDVAGLVDNLTARSAGRKDIPEPEQAEARSLAASTIDAFVRAAATVTPTGKQNTFAAHQLPAAVLVEVRPACTPVSYANAFVEPAWRGRDGDLVIASLQKLAKHVEALTAGFNLQAAARVLLAPEHDLSIAGVERVADLKQLCGKLREVMASG